MGIQDNTRNNNKELPFRSVYGLEAVNPLDMMVLTDQTTNYDQNNDTRL